MIPPKPPLYRRILKSRVFRVLAVLALAAPFALFFLFVKPPAASLPASASAGPAAPVARPAPDSLLGQVLAAHGGVERWRAHDRLRLRVRFGGLAFKLRLAEPPPTERWIELDLRAPRVTFHDFPKPGHTGHFTADKIWITDEGGRTVAERSNPRDYLLHSRLRQLWWGDLDLLYFAGYASWNYFQGPFLFLRDGVEAREIEPRTEGNETWRRLVVKFHPSIPTHSPEQVFYFDEKFQQRRHDYVPQVYAPWAKASLFTRGYTDISGFRFPTARQVYPRGSGKQPAGPLLVWIELLDAQFLPAGK